MGKAISYFFSFLMREYIIDLDRPKEFQYLKHGRAIHSLLHTLLCFTALHSCWVLLKDSSHANLAKSWSAS